MPLNRLSTDLHNGNIDNGVCDEQAQQAMPVVPVAGGRDGC